MKSSPGRISSTKLNMPPNAPFQPPNILKNISAEIGAQIISASSPTNGTAYVAYPRTSMSMQAASEGVLLNFFIHGKMMKFPERLYPSTLRQAQGSGLQVKLACGSLVVKKSLQRIVQHRKLQAFLTFQHTVRGACRRVFH